MQNLTPTGARRRALQTLGAAAMAALGLPAAAQSSADRVVKLILPNGVGSGVDTVARTAQAALGKALGHPVVVDNQPGAGGIVGVSALVKSAPDGFTLGYVSNNHVIYPSVYKSVPFDPIADITPIAVVVTTPVVLVVNPKVAAANAKELVALMKARPGEINFGSGGNGTILHLAGEMFIDEAGVQAKHIPYKGVGPMLSDLIGGQIEFATVALPSIQAHLKSGALRAIGVASTARTPAAPEIPTFVEQGMPGYVVDAWIAFVGPKGLPAAEVARLHAALVTTFAAPEVRDMMAKQGNAINVTSSESALAFFKSEMAKYAKLVKKAGIELQ